MQRDELESIAGRHVPGQGRLDIHRLSEGLVNETYRVLRDGSTYVMRVAASTHGLGLDHVWEARVLERAVLGGLAPALEYCDPRRGILISRWIDGKSWSPAEVRRAANISRMAALMRRIHALPIPTPSRIMSTATWIDQYAAALPDVPPVLRAAAAARLAALAELPGGGRVLCHSDLHTLNLIDCGASLVLLDWEYAHAADPLWDLAGWSANNDMEEEHQQDLLTSYVGRVPTAEEQARLRLLVWLYDYVCLLWSELYLKLPREGQRDGPDAGAVPAGAAPAATVLDGVVARSRLLAARLGRAPCPTRPAATRPAATRPGASK
jgi:thiamine kinase